MGLQSSILLELCIDYLLCKHYTVVFYCHSAIVSTLSLEVFCLERYALVSG